MTPLLLPFIVLGIFLCIRYLLQLKTKRVAEEILEEFKGRSIGLGEIFYRFEDRYSVNQIIEAIRYLNKNGHINFKIDE